MRNSSYYYGKRSAQGWREIILENNDFDEEKSLEVFFELNSKFMSLSIQNCQHTKLKESEIAFHHSSKYAPIIAYPPDNNHYEPLYLNPTEVLLFELINTGYILMVNTGAQHRVERRIYKSDDEVKEYLKRCFGSDLSWNVINMDNYDFSLNLSVV